MPGHGENGIFTLRGEKGMNKIQKPGAKFRLFDLPTFMPSCELLGVFGREDKGAFSLDEVV